MGLPLPPPPPPWVRDLVTVVGDNAQAAVEQSAVHDPRTAMLAAALLLTGEPVLTAEQAAELMDDI